MGDKTFRAESRNEWVTSDGAKPSTDQLKLGCLQRIADATESMAQEYNRLLREAKYLRQSRDGLADENRRFARRIAALRGTITRMKKAATP